MDRLIDYFVDFQPDAVHTSYKELLRHDRKCLTILSTVLTIQFNFISFVQPDIVAKKALQEEKKTEKTTSNFISFYSQWRGKAL